MPDDEATRKAFEQPGPVEVVLGEDHRRPGGPRRPEKHSSEYGTLATAAQPDSIQTRLDPSWGQGPHKNHAREHVDHAIEHEGPTLGTASHKGDGSPRPRGGVILGDNNNTKRTIHEVNEPTGPAHLDPTGGRNPVHDDAPGGTCSARNGSGWPAKTWRSGTLHVEGVPHPTCDPRTERSLLPSLGDDVYAARGEPPVSQPDVSEVPRADHPVAKPTEATRIGSQGNPRGYMRNCEEAARGTGATGAVESGTIPETIDPIPFGPLLSVDGGECKRSTTLGSKLEVVTTTLPGEVVVEDSEGRKMTENKWRHRYESALVIRCR